MGRRLREPRTVVHQTDRLLNDWFLLESLVVSGESPVVSTTVTQELGLLDDLDEQFFQLPWKSRLDQFIEQQGRPPHVLHVGNIANNGYNNAKILNAAGLWCDVIAYDYYHIMGCPEWEDADITGVIDDDFAPDFDQVDLGNFERPRWFVQGPRDVCLTYLAALSADDAQDSDELWNELIRGRQTHVKAASSTTTLARTWHRRRRIPQALRRRGERLIGTSVRTVRPSTSDFDQRVTELVAEFAARFPDRHDQLVAADIEPYRSVFEDWRKTFSLYDLIEANSTDPILPMLTDSHPYVAYEHGTIRDIPFDNTPTSRLTALAYALADTVVITNPDCLDAATRLGVSSPVFVPHLIDRKYYDRAASDSRPAPPGVRHPYIFCPARHHWDVKGNEVGIRAFAALAKENLDLQLVLSSWGPDVNRSRELLFELGIGHRAKFIDPLRIRDLISVTSNAAVLIDQFHFGVFGGIGPTALACGTPLVTNLDPELSGWCMTEPPYFQASDVASCITALDAALAIDRESHAREQLTWMQSNYWYGDVASRHIDIYLDLLASHEPNLKDPRV